MSVQTALNFLRQARTDEQIRAELQNVIELVTTKSHNETEQQQASPLVTLGRKHGFIFSSAELQTAFRHDWQMRAMYFRGQETA